MRGFYFLSLIGLMGCTFNTPSTYQLVDPELEFQQFVLLQDTSLYYYGEAATFKLDSVGPSSIFFLSKGYFKRSTDGSSYWMFYDFQYSDTPLSVADFTPQFEERNVIHSPDIYNSFRQPKQQGETMILRATKHFYLSSSDELVFSRVN